MYIGFDKIRLSTDHATLVVVSNDVILTRFTLKYPPSWIRHLEFHCVTSDSFPLPTYLFFKGDGRGDERLRRNECKGCVAGWEEQKNSSGLPLMQYVPFKTASGATGNVSDIT